MPAYEITDPQTGMTVELTGDSPPTEQELASIFASVGQGSAPAQEEIIGEPETAQPIVATTSDPVQAVAAQPDTTVQAQTQESGTLERIGEGVVAGAEIATALSTGVVAEPLAGLAGIAGTLFPGEPGQGARWVEEVREFLTYQPRGEAAREVIGAAGELLSPVAETLGKVESTLGNAALEATGSPAIAAAAHALPTAALELLGVKGLKGAKLKHTKLSPNVAEAITQAAPDIKTIKDTASRTYRELDDLGVRVDANDYNEFVVDLSSKLRKEGLDPDLTPKSTAVMRRLIGEVDKPKTPSELDTLRKVASSAAKSIERPDARIGAIIVDAIDDAIDKSSARIGGKFKQARGLAHRAFKSQTIADMVENASHTASGMENGLRIEARKILKNKNKRRGFSADEILALKKIEQGTTASNMAKFLGKFGISEGQATSMLGASIGMGGGGALGATFGGPAGAAIGAIGLPALGQIAKNTAQRLTLRNTKFADDLARAGRNAKEITKAYLKHTPVGDRRVSDLTDLFMDVNVDASDIKNMAKSKTPVGKLVADSLHFAKEVKRKAKQAASAAVIASPPLQQPEAQ